MGGEGWRLFYHSEELANKSKTKPVLHSCPTYRHSYYVLKIFMPPLLLLLTISLQIVKSSLLTSEIPFSYIPTIQIWYSLFHHLLIFVFLFQHEHLQKPSQRYFKGPVQVGLAVRKKIVDFWRLRNGSINLFENTGEENYFLTL